MRRILSLREPSRMFKSSRASVCALLVAVTSASAAGCSSGDSSNAAAPSPANDGGGDDAGRGGADSGAATRPAAVFLDPSDVADLVVIDAKLPFGVTRRHAADDAIAGSHWGRHGGPMVTTGVYGAGGASSPQIIQWSLPDAVKGAATRKTNPLTAASGLPSMLFYGADGMVDLPFGGLSLLSYTAAGSPFAGEALLYSATYGEVKSRAKVNGFYSGAGITDGSRSLLFYSGLSALSTAASGTSDNGLYAAEICAGALLSPAPCAAPKKVFGWKGQSGPVVADAHGNVFVGASLTSGKTSDEVYGIGRAAALAGAATTAITLAGVDTTGTASLAAIPPDEATDGWVFGLGFDAKKGVYGASYTESEGVLAKGSLLLRTAIVPAAGVEAISVFSDDEGDLWLAVTTSSTGAFLELRRRP